MDGLKEIREALEVYKGVRDAPENESIFEEQTRIMKALSALVRLEIEANQSNKIECRRYGFVDCEPRFCDGTHDGEFCRFVPSSEAKQREEVPEDHPCEVGGTFPGLDDGCQEFEEANCATCEYKQNDTATRFDERRKTIAELATEEDDRTWLEHYTENHDCTCVDAPPYTECPYSIAATALNKASEDFAYARKQIEKIESEAK
jgi:hypothetical protein